MSTTMKKLILSSLLLSAALLAAGSVYATPLYFPHVATTDGWQTEIAIINTGDQTVTGTLKGFSNGGTLVETKAVTLAAHGRQQINVATGFTNNTSIAYIVFESTSAAVQGYTKFYQEGKYRVAIPAVKEVNASNVIYITHIASNTQWWTGIGLVNTTSTAKTVTINFSDGQTQQVILAANGHQSFGLFNYQSYPDVQSAVITNTSGIIGLELFATFNGKEVEGILLTDKTASSLYYPYVVNDADWWTGIVAYNPFQSPCNITITSYNADGTYLSSPTDSISGMQKYVGTVGTQVVLPAQTAWFRIDSTLSLSGFELIGTRAQDRLASYAGNGGTGSKTGVFAKIEKSGGKTVIALVNTENNRASVTLTAYADDGGTPVASKVITIDSHAVLSDTVENIFLQNITNATYIAYTSDRNMVGLQLNYSADGTMLDGLPALGVTGGSCGGAL